MIKKMSYKIVAKFIRRTKFNIPDTNTFFNLSNEIKNYSIQFDITSKQIKEKTILVNTTLCLKPKKVINNLLQCEICLSSIVELNKDITDKKKLEEIILINVPSDVYEELREIFSEFFVKSGFKEIKIDSKVDFKKLYESKKIQ
jgi:preprotein translocase subunit SecB